MSTSRSILSGLDGFINGGFSGTLTGGASALIGSGIPKTVGIVSSATPVGPIVAASALGTSLCGAAAGFFLGYNRILHTNNSKFQLKNQQDKYDHAAFGTFTTTACAMVGGLLLKVCSEQNPAMRDIVPAVFIGAAIIQYLANVLPAKKNQLDEVTSTSSLKIG